MLVATRWSHHPGKRQRLRFTYGVPFRSGVLDCRKNKNPKQDRHFRAFSPGVAPSLVKSRG
jgi:hypothetical protein